MLGMKTTIQTWLFGLLVLTGCTSHETPADRQPVQRPLEGVRLRLAVADDPTQAAAILRLRGEWNAQTGSELEVEEIAERDLLAAESFAADAAIVPSHSIGALAERDWLLPVPSSILKGRQWGEILELTKLREAAWGKQIVAVPFGSPQLVCYYRADLLEKLGRRPPQTWEEYQELAKLLSENPPADLAPEAKEAWCGTIEPLAPGWAGVVLLARAAAMVKHRDNYSALFNVATMEPLAANSAMVEALKELVAAAKHGPADPFRYDPAAAREAFWNGRCGMALSWPTHASNLSEPTSSLRAGFVELPGSKRVFNLTGHVWDVRAEDEDMRVALLAAAGRMGVVNKRSPQADAAMQLLLWLSDDSNSPQVSAASPATTLFRKSHVKKPEAWMEKPASAGAAAQYAEIAESAFRHAQWIDALRIPGRAEYLAALDKAVRTTLEGKELAIDALLEAETQWRDINGKLGVDRQKAAYRHSLGLE